MLGGVYSAAPVLAQYREAFSTTVDNLDALVAIPTVSEAMPETSSDFQKAAGMIRRWLGETGMENVRVEPVQPGKPPLIYAEWLHAGVEAPTVLVYVHADVKPAGDLSNWKINPHPFRLLKNGDRLYGRGTSDNKAGVVSLISSLRAFRAVRGTFPVNLKVLVDGTEEIADDSLEKYLRAHLDRFEADVLMICDGENRAQGEPAVTMSSRGLFSFQVTLTTAAQPNHSGLFGGAIPTPDILLMELVAKLINPETGRLKIERKLGLPITLPLSRAHGPSDGQIRRNARLLRGVPLLDGAQSAALRIGLLPAGKTNGIQLSDDGRGVISRSATTRIDIRTVEGMDDPYAVEAALKAFFENKKKFSGLKIDVQFDPEVHANWWAIDPNDWAAQIGISALSQVYETPAVIHREGAAMPFAAMAARVLGIHSTIVYGLVDPQSNPHGPDESIDIRDFLNTGLSTILIWESLAHGFQGQ